MKCGKSCVIKLLAVLRAISLIFLFLFFLEMYDIQQNFSFFQFVS